jgi:hypothetical protein
MALLNSSFVSFVIGVLILLYLSTFVVFAVIRVLWGVSIQRLWWSGLRHLSYTPRDGLRIDIRGLRLSLHRPTFAQPTWVSVVITELKVTVDLRVWDARSIRRSAWARWRSGEPPESTSPPDSPASKSSVLSEPETETEAEPDGNLDERQAKTVERLLRIKEGIKRLHRRIQWIRMIDVVATNSSLVVTEVGSVQVSSFTMAVDTRAKTVDRGRLFHHGKQHEGYLRPAEWIMTARSVLFSHNGEEYNEVLDHATLNIHGVLSRKLEGLRDASIALKLGRLSIPYDDMNTCVSRIERSRRMHSRSSSRTSLHDAASDSGSPNLKDKGRGLANARELVTSILRGIHEFQFAVGYVGVSKRIESIQPTGAPIWFNMSMKEVGVDLLRLDPRGPAHLTYFSPSDIAHQALVTAISISCGIDDGHDHPERLLYVPLATATIKTTLPSKAVQMSGEQNPSVRNSNILFANLVVTSPSVDLDPKHLPLTIAILDYLRERPRSPQRRNRHHLISRLMPKAHIKASVHEPVLRVSLPCMEPARRGTGQFDLLISTISSMSLDVESSHSASGETHYSLAASYRISNHQLYYQTAAGEKHNLLVTDNLEVKIQISAAQSLAVAANVNLQTFSLYMIRPEISEGVRQIIVHLQRDASTPVAEGDGKRVSFLRRLPDWLHHVQVQGSDFNLEIAGIDSGVSENAKGTALHLGSWTAEYRADRAGQTSSRATRRKTTGRSVENEDLFLKTSASRRTPSNATDGRRLAINTFGLEAYAIESAETWESEPFISLPNFESVFTTLTDPEGPVMHINTQARHIYLYYSLYRHFAVGIALSVLRKTFYPPRSDNLSAAHSRSKSEDVRPTTPGAPSKAEITTVDFRTSLIQLKGTMPAEPNLMIQIFSVEAGRHRWTTPFVRAQLARMYAASPNVKASWSRVISARNVRLDYRFSRKKHGVQLSEEQSFDVAADAIRFGIPHQLVVHKIFDNLTNVVKTVEQLHHRFKTGTSEYILKKVPQGPKKVPKITFRAHALLFEIEDSAFEWKLGLIYVQGLHEQRQRLARDEAFRLKVKKIEEVDAVAATPREVFEAKERRGWRRGRHKRKSSEDVTATKRSKSAGDEGHRPAAASPERPTSRRLEYDADGTCTLSENAQRTIQEAKEALDRFNVRSWKTRIDKAYEFQEERMKSIRQTVWSQDKLPEGVEQHEKVMGIPHRPALMAIAVHDFFISIDKPTFPLHEYTSFLRRMGKGMPSDMDWALLIPMHVDLSMSDARATLRDYPIPIIHIPPLRPSQSPRLTAFTLSTDFVIAEEFRDEESIRHVDVVVVPPSGSSKGLVVDVRRTIGTMKTYSDIAVDINTAAPTIITWGASYQPAIQDMMQVIESFTKPAVDPSQRVGFWDKIRLSFHSRINVAWKSHGDVHLILKGSRDPYKVTGSGAGFVMCWRQDVRWSICQTRDPKKFMTVDSGEYVLAIPDFGHFARDALNNHASESARILRSSSDHAGRFKKTVMKLSGKVQWLAGIVFERNTDSGGRSFDFIPHYQIVLKNPKYAKAKDGLEYDAFRGFRSHYIHLSIAIAAPVDRDWTVTNLKSSSNYNSVHLSPRSFSHFFKWWSLFSGNMSLPIRQGKLWPGVDKSSKKFGRHLATIKYNLLLSPLYLSHMYKYKGPDEEGQSTIYVTGLKVKLDSFMLDLHQRREELRKVIQGRQTTTSGIRINKAQLDFISADFRAVSATIREITLSELANAGEEKIATYTDHVPRGNLANFTIPDCDTGWVDMDDFVELDWILPMESTPETQILPLAFAPRFTYFRQTDHKDSISGDPNRSSTFGNEDTHYCVMTARNDPRRVQCDIIQNRLDRIAEQLSQNQRNIGEHELHIIRDAESTPRMRKKLDAMRRHHDILARKQAFLQHMNSSLLRRLEDNGDSSAGSGDLGDDEYYEAKESYGSDDDQGLVFDRSPPSDDISDFNNRFIVHNAQLKWSNSLRDIVLRYIHQVSQRRGFVYYMSRPAVKFILDIVEEQNKARKSSRSHSEVPTTETGSTMSGSIDAETEEEINDRIQQLLDDGKRFVEASDVESAHDKTHAGLEDDISREFTAQNAYHVRVIAPQIQLQSEKNTNSAVLVTAKGMQLKVVQIMDKDRVTDDVSGLVQRRFHAAMDSLQVFVTSSKAFSPDLLSLYSANRYGAPAGSSWPPWVPLEDQYDFHVDPYGFSRVVQRTSLEMRYDKFNTLRLKYNDDVTSGQADQSSDKEIETRMDHIWVDFPRLLTRCDTTQFSALSIIVLDLLLYNEPQEKTREEKLEKIILASDFSDLSPAPGQVIRLQERIRTLQEIKLMFQLHEKTLTGQQWKERVLLENDLAQLEDELFFIMKAITTSQRRLEDRAQSDQATAILRWEIATSELVWHMVQGIDESLIELQLKNVQYQRVDNSDGSNDNTLEVGTIEGWTLLPNAHYPQLIAPFEDESTDKNPKSPMVSVRWYMLEAVAGIVVMQRFQVSVVPLKIQLEYETGIKVFEYIFPGDATKNDSDSSPFLVKHLLPTHREEDEYGEPDSTSAEMHTPARLEVPTDHLTGSGDLELRLVPTLFLPDPKPASKSPKKSKYMPAPHSDFRLLRPFGRTDSNDLRKTAVRGKKSGSSENVSSGARTPQRANSTASELSKRDNTELGKRLAMLRAGSGSTSAANGGKKGAQAARSNNDVLEMMDRASKYMTLTHVHVQSVVLCVSYKGKSTRKVLTDIHDLVFRLPTLEYRNKTWSNFDLVNHLRKEVVRALFGHTGAIIGSIFTHHRPSKMQQWRMREMANSSVLLGGTGSSIAESSLRSDAASSIRARSSIFGADDDDYDDRVHRVMDDDDSAYRSPSPRGSLASDRASTVSHDGALQGKGSANGSPAALTPTPSHADRLRASVTAALQRPKSAAAAAVGSRLSRFSLSPGTSGPATAASPPGSAPNGATRRPASAHGGGEESALGTRAAGVRRLRWRRSGTPAEEEDGATLAVDEDEADAKSER